MIIQLSLNCASGIMAQQPFHPNLKLASYGTGRTPLLPTLTSQCSGGAHAALMPDHLVSLLYTIWKNLEIEDYTTVAASATLNGKPLLPW